MSRKTPHSSTNQGKKVLVKLKSGLKFVGKFKEKKGSRILFFDHDEIRAGDLASFTIYKPSC